MTRAGAVAAALVAAVVASAAPAAAGPSPAPEAARDAAPRVQRADTVVGTGTPASCTSRAVVRAVARGGVIAFDCGPDPVTIAMKRTAKVVNTSAKVVLDGGGTVTLDGRGQRRILYMNTCDRAQVWTTSHCNDQAEPLLVVKRMRLARGNASAEAVGSDEGGGGGGAIFARGGRLRIVDSHFVDNRCARTGPDVGGAAVRVFDQYADRPVVVRRSSFTGGRCSNGSALSSIGVSWRVTGSTFTGNRAVGRGANPARPGTPGGGSGGAIYMDGDDIHLVLEDSTLTGNRAREGGGAIFFVSNDRSGTLTIRGSELVDNPSDGFETIPGIFFLGAGRTVTDSVVR
ncbi:hypothetical protein F4692_001411 [Nocardioides cavernae]|uniref:Right handed beta helix domain-containing protein n=1 Tax=Nocardioides cavernae TaxID=1921566 RepID=A0A7Y9H1M2_9ACTN|nr:hypothetical protein [Nocardioides cavernae]NYE36307.1 hypothetical protein [Nocardioides cavernae]